MSMYTDLVLLIKDNNGSVYLPEFNFNGIGDFTPGYGYQLKLSEPIEDFGLCGDYTNTESPEITDIETDNAQMQNDINCLTGNPEIGDHCYGGIVFYVEEGEEGKYGLVAAPEDLIEGATEPYEWSYIGYQWGCSNNYISGADKIAIGTGHQNTIDIVNQECITNNGGISAAQVSIDYESEGYSDWYLPSIDELSEIYNTIGNNSLQLNSSNFMSNNSPYWSSSESHNTAYIHSWYMTFDDGYIGEHGRNNSCRVRPIRSFGNWTMGCMDSLACNYNPEANMEDGSCNYAQEGYDCEGNELFQIDGFIYIGKYNGNDYYLSEGLSYWEEANLICNENGGHLVTISDNDENMFISNALINSQTDNLTFENWELRCEIGLKKIDGQWTWVTGEPVDFTKWSPQTNEPSGDGNCAHTNHDIYHPNYGSNYFGYWNDHSCNSGETRFILEIEN
tara:strand:- start:1039 stop:2385 length:1347 start_codon:yes stop_codon:yes gene_type:complete